MQRKLASARIEYERYRACNEAKLASFQLKKLEQFEELECIQHELDVFNGAERKFPCTVIIPAWYTKEEYFEGRMSFGREYIAHLDRMIGEIRACERALEAEIQKCEDDLLVWVRRHVCAPSTPMVGTNQEARRALYVRSVVGFCEATPTTNQAASQPLYIRSVTQRYSASNNIGTWTDFADVTMNIPLILMETNAIEVHVVLAFKQPRSRQLPGDILTMISGYVVDACARTRYRFDRSKAYTLTPEEVKQRKVVNKYVRPENDCCRRVYVANWAA